MSTNVDLKMKLQEKIASVYACLDQEDIDGYMTGFSDDASFESVFGVMAGKDVIRKFMDDHVASGMESGVRHFLCNFIHDINGETATLRFYVAKMQVKIGPSLIGSAAATCHFDLTQQGFPIVKICLDIDPASMITPE